MVQLGYQVAMVRVSGSDIRDGLVHGDLPDAWFLGGPRDHLFWNFHCHVWTPKAQYRGCPCEKRRSLLWSAHEQRVSTPLRTITFVKSVHIQLPNKRRDIRVFEILTATLLVPLRGLVSAYSRQNFGKVCGRRHHEAVCCSRPRYQVLNRWILQHAIASLDAVQC